MWSPALTATVSLARSSDMVILPLERIERAKNAIGAWINAEGRDVAPTNDAGGVNHKESSLARAFALAINAIEPRRVALGLEIGEQGKVQLPVMRKRDMAPRAVYRPPSSSASNQWNSSRIPLYSAI